MLEQAKLEQRYALPDEDCRALVGRILASKEFRRTSRLRDFLLYVVDRKLAGATDEISEILIGQRVFGRPAGYNPGDDSIVRTEARNLRQRLERYFADEGRNEPVLIEIPRGGYLPVFNPRTPPLELQPASLQHASPQSKWLWTLAAIFGLTLIVAVALFARRSKEAEISVRSLVSSPPGAIALDSSDSRLVEIFQGAKQRAMSYVYTGDPVGDWYDSTAGTRYAFCMRDVSHQRLGAAALGLTTHTRNMLRRFAASIARNRDWAGYWEINKDGFPAPVDYRGDNNFWYCLPANFDLMRASYQEFLWTGDQSYFDVIFSDFYDRTVTSYVDAWDRDRDGVMESSPELTERGIASYYQDDPRPATGADLLAAQYIGYLTYATIQERKGEQGSLSKKLAEQYRAKAQALRTRFNTQWWNTEQNRYFSSLFHNGKFNSDYIADSNVYSLRFGITEEGPKTEAALDSMEKFQPKYNQAFSYYPEVLYEYGRNESAYRILQQLANPESAAAAMPEVSFALVGAIVSGMMGVSPDAPHAAIETLPRLPKSLAWVELAKLPVLQNQLTIRHNGTLETALSNEVGPLIYWKASFAVPTNVSSGTILVDGVPTRATVEHRANRQITVSVVIPVKTGASHTAKYSSSIPNS